MGFDQYHEPPEELPAATRTFARLCASVTEEAEAIGWYEQRLAVETDPEAIAVMRDAQGEEFKGLEVSAGDRVGPPPALAVGSSCHPPLRVRRRATPATRRPLQLREFLEVQALEVIPIDRHLVGRAFP